MIAVVQRVTSAHVTVGGEILGQIAVGLVALVAVHADDSPADSAWMAGKIATLRIFPNADKTFDLDIQQVSGSLLVISNFTVAADASAGRRPSLSPAAPPAIALPLFNALLAEAAALGLPVQTGQFAADMHVEIHNDGPATFLLDSRTSRKSSATR